MRDISAAARAASIMVGAGPCRSQARVAQTGSAGSPPRGALRVRAGGVSVSSGAGLSTLGKRAGEFAPDVDCGLELPAEGGGEFFCFGRFAGGSRSRARLVEPGPAGDMRAAGESQRSPGPARAFWFGLGRLHFKSRRQRSERQSAEPFHAAAFQRSYQLKAPSVDIRARAADLPSRRRRSVPRRSNSNSTRPRSLCPWWCAGPRSCAGRRSAGAVIPGPRGGRVRSSRGFKPQPCFESRLQILQLCASYSVPTGLSCCRFDAWQPRYVSAARTARGEG